MSYFLQVNFKLLSQNLRREMEIQILNVYRRNFRNKQVGVEDHRRKIPGERHNKELTENRPFIDHL